MAANATRLMTALLMMLLASGCATSRRGERPVDVTAFPAAEAPRIELGMDSSPTISTVSHQLMPAMTLVDARPDIEKLYYPGETDPHQWRDAVTVLPLESFQPDLEKALREQVVRHLKNAVQYRSIELRVKSFHVALDERERGESELLKDYMHWEEDREREEAARAERKRLLKEQERDARQFRQRLGMKGPGDDDEDESFGDAVMSGLFHATVTQPIRNRRLRAERRAQLSVAPQTLPEVLVADKQSGWNCRLVVDVVLAKEEGKSETLPVSVATHVVKDDAVAVEKQIQQAVMSAIDEFGVHIRNAAP
ncbi:MAG: hypothetical protein RIK87_01295 [Fuerstiella sp.]